MATNVIKFSYEDLTIVGTGEKLSASTFNVYRQRHGVLVAVPRARCPWKKPLTSPCKPIFV
ncbi:MAG: hypothetical protein HC880_11675 [Bacteroidia bacterium]|nr:hypothetical protein [Bacteroidia bacterium]